MSRPSQQLNEWLQRFCTEHSGGTRLPAIRRLASVWNLSTRTVSSVFKKAIAEGLVVSVQGKGCFVAPLPTVGEDSLDEKKSADEELVDHFLKAIRSGNLKYGTALPLVKKICLQFRVTQRTVARAYRALAKKGYAVKVGKTYWLGNFEKLISVPLSREIYAFVRHKNMSDLFADAYLGPAYQAMEEILVEHDVRLRYEHLDAFDGLFSGWWEKRAFPAGILFTGIDDPQYDLLRPRIRKMALADPSVRPAILCAGRKGRIADKNVDLLSHGHIPTSRSRAIARMCVSKGVRQIQFVYDESENRIGNFYTFFRIWPEIERGNPNIDVAFVYRTDSRGSSDAVIRYLLEERNVITKERLMGAVSKYRKHSFEEIVARIQAVSSIEKLFGTVGDSTMWVFSEDRLAAQVMDMYEKTGKHAPDDYQLVSLENNPAFLHLGISACMPDFKTIGYLMAHALLRDIPIAKTRSGLISTKALMLNRQTTYTDYYA